MVCLLTAYRKIRQEANELRVGLPAFLQWSPETGNTHPAAASLHLEFLFQELLLSQTVAKRTGEAADSCIDASRQIISHILNIISKQVRMGSVDYLTCNDVRTLHGNHLHSTKAELTLSSSRISASQQPESYQRNSSASPTPTA